MLNNACLVCGSKRHLAGYHERSATSVQRPAPKKAARTAAVTSDGNKLGVNLGEHLLDEAWLPMTMVLAALGEKSTNNARRYLCESSDCPRKRWTFRRQNNVGVEGRDWKVAASKEKVVAARKVAVTWLKMPSSRRLLLPGIVTA